MRFKISVTQKQRDASGLRNICGACGHCKTGTDPLVISEEGSRIHQSHFEDATSGFYGRPHKQDQS